MTWNPWKPPGVKRYWTDPNGRLCMASYDKKILVWMDMPPEPWARGHLAWALWDLRKMVQNTRKQVQVPFSDPRQG